MICPKGSQCSKDELTVKTISKAKEWYEDTQVSDLPIKILSANGRQAITIFNSDHKIIHRRG